MPALAVDAPTFHVKVKPVGEDAVRLDLGSRLVSLSYEDHERKADKLAIVIDNWDLAHFDDPIFTKGNLVEVSWGYPGNMAPPRKVKITKISGFQQLQVTALDLGTVMNTLGHQEAYENLTRAGVAELIAERNGFGSDQQYIQATRIVYPCQTQARVTDAQYMRRLAHREGFEFYIDFDGFHFHERVMDQAPVRKFIWYNAEDNSDGVVSIEVKNDVYAKPARVKVKAIDPDTKAIVEGEGSNDATNRKGTGEKTEFFVEVEKVSDNLEAFQKNLGDWERPAAVQGETGAADTKNDADKRFRKATQTAVKMSMVVIGDPSLIAKTVVRVEGVGKRLTGNYYVKGVKHEVSASYLTTLELISDGTRGYVRISDVLFEDPRPNSPANENEQDNKADPNTEDVSEDLTLMTEAFGALEDELSFFDRNGRRNLPGSAT